MFDPLQGRGSEGIGPQERRHPSVGEHPAPTLPFKYSGVERWTNRASPTLGQDTRDVLTRVLGKTEAECDQLELDGVIGTRPKGV